MNNAGEDCQGSDMMNLIFIYLRMPSQQVEMGLLRRRMFTSRVNCFAGVIKFRVSHQTSL